MNQSEVRAMSFQELPPSNVIFLVCFLDIWWADCGYGLASCVENFSRLEGAGKSPVGFMSSGRQSRWMTFFLVLVPLVDDILDTVEAVSAG